MADPLSVIAGVAGVSIACAQLANATFTICDKTRHAPKDLRDIGSNMSLLSSILDSLAGVLEKGQDMCKPRLLSDTNTIIARLRVVRREVKTMIKSKPGLRGRLNWALLDHGKTMEILQRIEGMKTALMLVLATIQLAIAQEGREDHAKQERLSALVACAVSDSRQCVIQQSQYAQWRPQQHFGPYSTPTIDTPAMVDHSDAHMPSAPKVSSSKTPLPSLSTPPYKFPEATSGGNPKAATVSTPRSPMTGISSRDPAWGQDPNRDSKAVSSPPKGQPSIVPSAFPQPPMPGPVLKSQDSLPPPHDGATAPLWPYGMRPEFFDNIEESSLWLYHLVFEPEKELQSLPAMDTSKDEGSANTVHKSGKAKHGRSKTHMTVKVGNNATETQIMSLSPSPEYLYGLSIRDTVENLVQAWTYVKLSELPLRIVLPEDPSPANTGANPKTGQDRRPMVQDTPDNKLSYYTDEESWDESSGLFVSDTSTSSDVEIEESRTSRGPSIHVTTKGKRNKPNKEPLEYTTEDASDNDNNHPPFGFIPKRSTDKKQKRKQNKFDGYPNSGSRSSSVEAKFGGYSTPESRNSKDQADLNQSFETLLGKVEEIFQKFGDDARKAEKSRQEIEAFKKKEQDIRFTRLENMIAAQIENWKIEQKNHNKAMQEANRQATKMRKEEDERIRKLEEAFLAASRRAESTTATEDGMKTSGLPVEIGVKRVPPLPPTPPPVASYPVPPPPPPPPSFLYEVKSGSSTSSRRKSQRSDWLWGQPKARKKKSRTARSAERDVRR